MPKPIRPYSQDELRRMAFDGDEHLQDVGFITREHVFIRPDGALEWVA